MKTKKRISEAEVRAAIKKFTARGGLIRKLPDEKVIRPNMVGSYFGIYENPLHELNARNTI